MMGAVFERLERGGEPGRIIGPDLVAKAKLLEPLVNIEQIEIYVANRLGRPNQLIIPPMALPLLDGVTVFIEKQAVGGTEEE